MDRIRLLMSLLLLSPLSLQAAGRLDVDTLCAPWLKVPVPVEDVGTAPEDCSASALYYGLDGTEGDPVAARHCAYRERAAGGRAWLGSTGVLMMVYANGEGVPRDLALARRFVCEHDSAQAEVRSRLAQLQHLETGEPSARFDLCDHVTSGEMGGVCAGRKAGVAHQARLGDWQALQSDWTPAQRTAWHAVREAADTYFLRVSGNEIDRTGTARNALSTQAQDTLETALLEDVRHFEAGARPGQDAQALAVLDRDLNAVYRDVRARLQAGADTHPYALAGTVSAEGVREAQRAWLQYRDAWVHFAGARWPDTHADAWRAWLTDRRIAALEAILDGP